MKTILSNLDFPEGPAVDGRGAVWFVELRGGSVCRLGKGGELLKYAVAGGKPNGIAIDGAGRVWFCDAGNDCVSVLNPENGEIKTACREVGGGRLAHPNDLAFDPRGNLAFTCPGESRKEPSGYVCALGPGGVRKIAEGKFFPNGLAFSPDGKSLFVAETYKRRIWKGDWDPETLSWSNARVWAEAGGNPGPDGMAFGDDGLLYAAVFGMGAVRAFSPDGRPALEIGLAGRNPTNCAFLPGGGLVVTEAERGELVLVETGTKPAGLFRAEPAWR